jgi:catechol 2,3-dioxygenase-like lactoylglutathione lyase family enzyme
MALYYSKPGAYSQSMLSRGIATIFVTDMDRSVRFYTEVLGLSLTQRFGNHWAQVEAGQLVIGLHPASAQSPAGRRRESDFRALSPRTTLGKWSTLKIPTATSYTYGKLLRGRRASPVPHASTKARDEAGDQSWLRASSDRRDSVDPVYAPRAGG